MDTSTVFLSDAVKIKNQKINLDATVPIEAQMALLSYYAYDDYLPKFSHAGFGWVLIESVGNKYSVQGKLFRKLQTNGKFIYTVAFRGTDSWLDMINNLNQIGVNSMKGQAYEAEAYVKKVVLRFLPNMKAMYLTGHSLGGYLAQWVQSEIDDGLLYAPIPTSTYTFNAPGFTKLKHVTNPYYLSVKRKLANPEKYSNIYNVKIKGDPVSLIGTTLGEGPTKILEIKHPLEGFDAIALHQILRFIEYYDLPISS